MIDENWIYFGAILNVIGSLSYCIATIKGETMPNRVTWLLWALAPLVAFVAMVAEGVSIKLASMTFMTGFGPLLVFIVSFVNKSSIWRLSRFDIVCGALSLAGIFAWAFTRIGDTAIIFSIIADGLALLPTLIKAWREPETESSLVFFFGATSAFITLLAAKHYSFTVVGFPAYVFIVCVLLFVLIQLKLGKRIASLIKERDR